MALRAAGEGSSVGSRAAMGVASLVACLLTTLALAHPAAASGSFTMQGSHFLKDGAPYQIISGRWVALHVGAWAGEKGLAQEARVWEIVGVQSSALLVWTCQRPF